MKYKIWKKLAIGLSAVMAFSIPAVFITSCGVKPQPKPEPQYIETKFFDEEKILKYYNKSKYLNWETGEIQDNPNCYFSAQILGRPGKLYLDPNLPNPKGVTLIERTYDTWQLKFSPEVYNVKTPHEKVEIVIRNQADFYQIQHITIPAYDGMGKSIGNWKSYGTENLAFPWECNLNNSTHKYECEGPSHLDSWGRGHYMTINEDVLCSTRIISLPANTSHILPGAFDIQEDRKMDCYDQDRTKRPACCKAFHEYMFGTSEHPETGLWQHLVFEGDVIPEGYIEHHAFFRCYSLQKDLEKYYGPVLADYFIRGIR